MKFYIGIIIDPQGSDEANATLADSRLEALDANKEVPLYKKYMSHEDRQLMESHYHTQSPEELASKMLDWDDEEGGFDEKGLYSVSKRNPNGIIDDWQLFGPNEVKDNIFNEPGCRFVITAAGQLHRGPIVFAEDNENEAKLDAWDDEVREITTQSKGKLAYVAYCHS